MIRVNQITCTVCFKAVSIRGSGQKSLKIDLAPFEHSVFQPFALVYPDPTRTPDFLAVTWYMGTLWSASGIEFTLS